MICRLLISGLGSIANGPDVVALARAKRRSIRSRTPIAARFCRIDLFPGWIRTFRERTSIDENREYL